MSDLADMDAATLRRAIGLVQRHTGIAMPPAKQGLLQTRLRMRMRALDINSYSDYLHRAVEDPAELPAFVDAVTTHQTGFFRTPALWQWFEAEALPQWSAANPAGRLQVWSAAASSGEEACTIAMCCDAWRPQSSPGLHWQILATDISAAAIAQASAGRYNGSSAAQFRAARPAQFAHYNHSGADDVFQLSAELQAAQRHDTHHLLQPCPWPRQFDVVFLRNVLIYFDGEALRRIVQAVLASLRPQGLLVVGESESLTALQAPLQFVRPQVYRLIAG